MHLEDFTELDFENYMSQGKNNYAKEIQKARNISFDEALEISTDEFKKTLPNGFHTKNNYFYTIKDHEQSVGIIWICIYQEEEKKKTFIYDINIKQNFRNKGYGKKGIKLIENKALELETIAVGLHVFFQNEIAYNLYKKLGYVETKKGKKSAEMEKVL